MLSGHHFYVDFCAEPDGDFLIADRGQNKCQGRTSVLDIRLIHRYHGVIP